MGESFDIVLEQVAGRMSSMKDLVEELPNSPILRKIWKDPLKNKMKTDVVVGMIRTSINAGQRDPQQTERRVGTPKGSQTMVEKPRRNREPTQ